MSDTQDQGRQLTLRMRGFSAQARVGVTEVEKACPQKVVIDVDIPLDEYRGGPPQVDYDDACEALRSLLAGRQFGLLEELANAVGSLLEERFGVRRYRVACSKPRVHRDVDDIWLVLERR